MCAPNSRYHSSRFPHPHKLAGGMVLNFNLFVFWALSIQIFISFLFFFSPFCNIFIKTRKFTTSWHFEPEIRFFNLSSAANSSSSPYRNCHLWRCERQVHWKFNYKRVKESTERKNIQHLKRDQSKAKTDTRGKGSVKWNIKSNHLKSGDKFLC